MGLAMSKQEREAFLADVHVGVISISDGDRGPLTVPIWYGYDAGEVWFVTARESRKGKRLAVGARISLCAQSEQPPYKYVSVEGPVVTVEPAELERDRRPLAHRYLGRDLGDRYIQATSGDSAEENVVVRMRPERWLSVDYAKEYGSV